GHNPLTPSLCRGERARLAPRCPQRPCAPGPGAYTARPVTSPLAPTAALPARAPLRLRAPVWLLALLAWTGVALLMAGQTYVSSLGRHATLHAEPTAPTFGTYVWASLTDWYAWAALSPLLLLAARRLSVRRLGWTRALAAHLPLSALFACL